MKYTWLNEYCLSKRGVVKEYKLELCTLYPMPNYFIALVVVGSNEEEEVELYLN